ncbi:MAG TPA: fused MFS/spermidine synthase [Thermoanaerobaculia bacterium]|jgi:predicted membrane-bound spermidine synthase|nr:fused MFS/spermidine synthase [Thermoanaerobaculia bacterium]
MRSAVGRVALLLFGSGFCALVYQTAWLRMFRLVFGASTAASAAVLAIFMAGLGFGGLWLGRWADRHPSPLGLYATLETGIAVSAGLSPWLVALAQWVYVGLGGSARLGLAGSTVVRLVLSTLVLAAPTFLMGGTLPAVARAVERSADSGRRVVGLLYAVNTLGAVLGTLATTFFSLEVLGIRKSIWIAALLNLLVVLAARSLAREMARELPAAVRSPEEPAAPDAGSPWMGRLVPVAAAVVGFSFLLMELVWYRLLGPLLGGSSYTFGLILAVALLGIGAGGLLYGAGEGARRPTLLAFAGTCSLEALCLALPFALGDRVAVLAALLRPLSGAGFLALAGGWTAVTVLVVLPAAVVAGYQFPLLIALLGAGRRQVGREVGVTYAANTLGAIVGSIAGGFGLIPWLTAPGVWRLVALLLLGLAGVAIVLGARAGRPGGEPRRAALMPLAAGVLGLLCCVATGPTPFWRHSPIGAGRVTTADWNGPNDVKSAIETQNRRIVWQADGVESSVALDLSEEYAFIVNGKSDGSALGDSPTQVMSGLVGAVLHPGVHRVLVIGLGTGSTAGWLARVPTVERVDVVELEPAIVHVARTLSQINQDVLANPKVHLVIGDGREVLVTTPETYDLVFSEPSNPYRAGVASLFSADFYRSVRRRLRPGGIFLQWLQGYELDAQVVRTAYATLASVFPAVESWRIQSADLLLMATVQPVVHDLDRVRARIATEPYRTALARTWGVDGIEGLYAGYVSAPPFARAVRRAEGSALNTDDRSILEFGFARNLGRFGLFRPADLQALVAARREDRPATRGAPLDWSRVAETRVARGAYWDDFEPDPDPQGDPAARLRIAARQAAVRGQQSEACARWFQQPEPPRSHADLLLIGLCLAEQADPRTPEVAARLAREQPIEADLILAFWHTAAVRPREAGERLLAAFQAYRTDPWVYRPLMRHAFSLLLPLARSDRDLGIRLAAALERPFATRMFDGLRRANRVSLTQELSLGPQCAGAIGEMEPHVPWEERFLAYRYDCYRLVGSPLADRAGRDLEAFRAALPPKLATGLAP